MKTNKEHELFCRQNFSRLIQEKDYLPLIKLVSPLIKRYSRIAKNSHQICPITDYDDLIQTGALTVIQIVNNFKLSGDIKKDFARFISQCGKYISEHNRLERYKYIYPVSVSIRTAWDLARIFNNKNNSSSKRGIENLIQQRNIARFRLACIETMVSMKYLNSDHFDKYEDMEMGDELDHPFSQEETVTSSLFENELRELCTPEEWNLIESIVLDKMSISKYAREKNLPRSVVEKSYKNIINRFRSAIKEII